MEASTRRYFGCHVSSSGGLHNALANGKELGVNTIQIHASPPQRWNSKPFAPGIEDAFLAAREESGVEKVFFHGVYLINLATANPAQLHMGKLSLVHCMDLLSRIGGHGVIFHVGSGKDHENEVDGWKQAAEAITWILNEAPRSARLLLEVAAGSGRVIGDQLEDLRAIFDMVPNPDNLGFALDSQHMWASGYALDEELDKIVDDVERVFGLDRVGAIHLNDSKTERGSRKDRHENLGDGLIGGENLRRLFLHPKLSNIPFILETPGLKALETAAVEVSKLRAWLGSA